MQAPGLTGIDKSKVSRICQALDKTITALHERPLAANYPYLWLDTLYLKVRQNHQVVSRRRDRCHIYG